MTRADAAESPRYIVATSSARGYAAAQVLVAEFATADRGAHAAGVHCWLAA